MTFDGVFIIVTAFYFPEPTELNLRSGLLKKLPQKGSQGLIMQQSNPAAPAPITNTSTWWMAH